MIALFFAVHAQYRMFFAEYMPASTLERGIRKASNKAIQLLDTPANCASHVKCSNFQQR